MRKINLETNGALPARKRGRPPKFGRPARLVALTLPDDVLAWLGTIDSDIGRAIVALYEKSEHHRRRAPLAPPAGAEIVEVAGGRGLILVNPGLVGDLKGVSAIPFASGRAFLALEPSWTIADLELAVLDCLERAGRHDARPDLKRFRDQLKTWRRSKQVEIKPRSIIVVERRRKRTNERRHGKRTAKAGG